MTPWRVFTELQGVYLHFADTYDLVLPVYWSFESKRGPFGIQPYLFPQVVNEYCTFVGEVTNGEGIVAHICTTPMEDLKWVR